MRFIKYLDGGIVLHYDVANKHGQIFRGWEYEAYSANELRGSYYRLEMRLVLLRLGVLTV